MHGHGVTFRKTLLLTVYICTLFGAPAVAQQVHVNPVIATLIRGDCKIRKNGTAAWSSASRFAAMFDGSEMRTVSDGTAFFMINASASRVFFDSRTHAGFGVVSGRPDRRPEKEIVNLHNGRMFLQVKKGRLVSVNTPTGTCAIEGQFVVSFSDSSKTCEVMAVEGFGSFRATVADSAVTLEKGNRVSFQTGSVLNGPVPIGERKADIDAFLGKIEKMK